MLFLPDVNNLIYGANPASLFFAQCRRATSVIKQNGAPPLYCSAITIRVLDRGDSEAEPAKLFKWPRNDAGPSICGNPRNKETLPVIS